MSKQTLNRELMKRLMVGRGHLVDAVAKAAELVHPRARLHVRVVPCPDGAHACRLVARV